MADHQAEHDGHGGSPSEYRPDLRPMLILAGLLVVIVLGWVVLAPRILPPADPDSSDPGSSTTGLDGRWTRTPDDARATTLALSGASYTLTGALGFGGTGTASRDGEALLLSDDAVCPGADGRYAVELGDIDRHGLLPEHRAQTMTLSLVTDACSARADAVAATWVLRLSGREGVFGICDAPNEEAAISGHWPEPSGCG